MISRAIFVLMLLILQLDPAFGGSQEGVITQDGSGNYSYVEPEPRVRGIVAVTSQESKPSQEISYDSKGLPTKITARGSDGSTSMVKFKNCMPRDKDLVCEYIDERTGASGRMTFPNYSPSKPGEPQPIIEGSQFNAGTIRMGAGAKPKVIIQDIKTKSSQSLGTGQNIQHQQSVGNVK